MQEPIRRVDFGEDDEGTHPGSSAGSHLQQEEDHARGVPSTVELLPGDQGQIEAVERPWPMLLGDLGRAQGPARMDELR